MHTLEKQNAGRSVQRTMKQPRLGGTPPKRTNVSILNVGIPNMLGRLSLLNQSL